MGFFNEGTKSLLKTHYNVKVETNMLSRRTKKKKKHIKNKPKQTMKRTFKRKDSGETALKKLKMY